MSTVTNKEIINSVAEEMPQEMGDKIKNLEGESLLKVLDNYPSTSNAFINTLTNKVAKSLIYSKIYKNQLQQLKKGKLEYGDSIEEIFVQMAQVKGFTANWDKGANTPEADLIRKLVPKVSTLYIQTNVDYKGKATIMDKQLRKAFINEGGLSKIIMHIVGSITSGLEYKEFIATKAVLNNLVTDAKMVTGINDEGEITTAPIPNIGKTIKQTPYIVNTKNSAEDLSVAIRETTGLMEFPSDKFNLAKEITWTKPDELVLLTTPTESANLDVRVLANAFNVSMADLKVRTILVDEMPTGIFQKTASPLVDKLPTELPEGSTITSDATKKPRAILMDNELVQIWDTHQGAGTFHNPEGEYTNHFGNREGIFATCLFANMAIFY